jgi:hypothetical protein
LRSRYVSFYAEVVLTRLASLRRTPEERTKLLALFKQAEKELSKNHKSDVEQEYRRQNVNLMATKANALRETGDIYEQAKEENPEFVQACELVRGLEVSFGGPPPRHRRDRSPS